MAKGEYKKSTVAIQLVFEVEPNHTECAAVMVVAVDEKVAHGPAVL